MAEANSRKICVLFPGALGDFICFLPALEILWHAAPVELLARTEFADLLPAAVRVNSLERFEVRRLFAPGATKETRLQIFFGAYHSIFSWMGSRQREFVAQLASLSQERARVFPFQSSHRRMHQTDYYLSCLDALSNNPAAPTVPLQEPAAAWIGDYWVRQSLDGKAVLVLAPGSGAREKNWPIAFYRTLADWWRHRTQGAVIVLVGPVEEEREGFDALLPYSIVARHLTLAQVAALLARIDLYVGNDSGMTHLSAAVGVRTVALFGPSDVRQWAPRGEKVSVLSRNVTCSPCLPAVMKDCSPRQCLTGFTPEEVIREIEKLPEIATLTRGGVGIRV
jgi:ADP-heptose:LPS heptosyltransferase